MNAKYFIVFAVALLGVGLSVVLAWPPEPPPSLEASESQPPQGVVHYRGLRDGPPRVATDRKDAKGQPISLACSSCHPAASTDTPPRAEELDRFHQGLRFDHGTLSCHSCHDPDAMDSLRLADGKTLPYRDVMELCGQCHGPQRRDYLHGSHGGMTGYWDLRRGDRVRNACTVCHDPHAPAVKPVLPVFEPRDTHPRGEHP